MVRAAFAAFAAAFALAGAALAAAPAVEVTIPASVEAGPTTGRLVVVFSDRPTPDPRDRIKLGQAQIYGADVEQLAAGRTFVLPADAPGYPLLRTAELPAGDWWAQAVLIRYDKVTRWDGHTLWVPIRPGRTGTQYYEGNLYSAVQKVIVPASGTTPKLAFSLDRKVGPPEPLPDTPWLKQVRIKSEILSKFWGAPIYLGATVLLPRDFDQNPSARYPIVYAMSHGPKPFGFEPDPELGGTDWLGADANVQTGHDFYRTWIRDDFPRFLVASIYQAGPYWSETYSLDSANNGPVGQALTQELVPHLEKTFRAIGKPYSRMVEGASTGGWESLAMQVHYPDFFGGAWVFNPDPISFKSWQLSDIYEDANLFETELEGWGKAERPYRRTIEGQVVVTAREGDRFERVLGTKGRANKQYAIWQASYGPVGPDGYPVPLWDETGRIDHKVAHYMRDRGYDLTAHVEKNWATLAPKLDGKINLIAGEMDNFYLNLGVYDFQEMTDRMGGREFRIRYEYGRPMKGHNWHHVDFSEMLREMGDHIVRSAPKGEDSCQWNLCRARPATAREAAAGIVRVGPGRSASPNEEMSQ